MADDTSERHDINSPSSRILSNPALDLKRRGDKNQRTGGGTYPSLSAIFEQLAGVHHLQGGMNFGEAYRDVSPGARYAQGSAGWEAFSRYSSRPD